MNSEPWSNQREREESDIFGIHFTQDAEDILEKKKSSLLLGQENLREGLFLPGCLLKGRPRPTLEPVTAE